MIHSIDVHPDGTRLATGGGDNHARIWAVAPICFQSAQDDEEKHPRELAVLTRHAGALNVVRWSNNGAFLATGSDDNTAMVWRLIPGVSALGNHENWGCCLTLKGHTADVKDIAWSPQDDILATCSIDNTVRVWQVAGVKEAINSRPISVLRGHENWVRGLSWDPVGKYLASSGDDNALILWRTSDWKQERRITEPFSGSTSMCTVRRINWSPDGKSLCVSHAFKRPRHVAALVERGDWTSNMSLVGHDTPVGAVRFSGRLYAKSSHRSKKSKSKRSKAANGSSRMLCAVGSQDATLSIWMTAQSRPLAIIRNLFEAEISDLSWNSTGEGPLSGRVLFACSLEGSIACLQFEGDELGEILPAAKTRERLRNIYGVSAFATDNLLVESTSQLALERNVEGITNDHIGAVAAAVEAAASIVHSAVPGLSVQPVPKGVPTMTSSEASVGLSARAMGSSSITAGMRFASSRGTNSPVRKKQIETKRKKDGKKRITPVLIVENHGNSGTANGNGNSGSGYSNRGNGPRPAAMPSAISEKDRLRGVISVNKPTPESWTNSAHNEAKKTNAKKRVALISVGSSGENMSEPHASNSAPSDTDKSSVRQNSKGQNPSELSATMKLSDSNKRLRTDDPGTFIERASKVGRVEAQAPSAVAASSVNLPSLRQLSSESSSYAASSRRTGRSSLGITKQDDRSRRCLPLPPRKSTHSVVAYHSNGAGGSGMGAIKARVAPTMIEFRVVSSGIRPWNRSTSVVSADGSGKNPAQAAQRSVLESRLNSHMDPARTTVVTCTRGGSVLWRSRVSGFGSLIVGNKQFTAMATTAGEIYLFSPTGRHMAPPMIMPEPLAFLECCTYAEQGHSTDISAEIQKRFSGDRFLMGMTVAGSVYIWDVMSGNLIVRSKECLRSILASVENELCAAMHAKHPQNFDPNCKRVHSEVSRTVMRMTRASNEPSIIVTVLASSTSKPGTASSASKSQPSQSSSSASLSSVSPSNKSGGGLGSRSTNTNRLSHSFVYDPCMKTWVRVADQHFAQSDFSSDFGNRLLSHGMRTGMRPLESLQATGSEIGSSFLFKNGARDYYEWGDTPQQWYQSRAHLEHQIAAALVMDSPDEYQQWIQMYARFLAKDGREPCVARLRELCDELLGPPSEVNGINSDGNGWSSTVLGLSKRHILKQRVLPGIASNRALQRVVNEYSEMLKSLEG